MRAGRLRHRIQLQSSTRTQDAVGGATDSWATYKTVWGEVQPLRGQERILADQIQSEVTHKIRIRYDGDTSVLPEHRAVARSRTFAINAVMNVFERDRERELHCTELVT